MKKTLLFLFAASLFFKANADDIITLDLQKPTNPVKFDVFQDKGHWVETYNGSKKFRKIDFDFFSLTHNPGSFSEEDSSEGYYWDGFTYCTSGDTKNYGMLDSSDGWISNQWGCMAGGGIKTDELGNVMMDENGKVIAQAGIPYLVANWGYWMELFMGGDPCLQVRFNNGKMYKPQGIYICNHPWPYYGTLYGDGFASPFKKEGDMFKLTIHGFNEDGKDIGIKVDHILAEFKDGELKQSPDWQWVDLSSLGAVTGIYFTMESTDVSEFDGLGPNTAVYFCMDKLQVKEVQQSIIPNRPTGLIAEASESNILFSWNEAVSDIVISGYNIYVNEELLMRVENVTEYLIEDLKPFTEYLLGIEAIAIDGEISDRASITINTTDITAPTKPMNLEGETSLYTITLTWDVSSDNFGVKEYNIYLNGEKQKRVSTTEYTLTGLESGTEYLVEIEAVDYAGNRSEKTAAYIKTQSSNITDLENDNHKEIISFKYLKDANSIIIETEY